MKPGAYGLQLPDLPGAADLLVDAPESWPSWHTARREEEGQPREFVSETQAWLRSAPRGWVEVDRARQLSTLNLPTRVTDREVVHPYLASTASVTAHWHGMQSFHAGAFILDGTAWAVLGDRGAGKSSLLAYLAREGLPILTDDVLVLRGETALAGPRCIDLRAEPASWFKAGEALGKVGTRERWRLTTPPVDSEVRIAGWIYLDWGDAGIGVVPPSERIDLLLRSLSLRISPRNPDQLLNLLALPMLAMRRRQDFDALETETAGLLSYLSRI